jgi:hypothetical protein
MNLKKDECPLQITSSSLFAPSKKAKKYCIICRWEDHEITVFTAQSIVSVYAASYVTQPKNVMVLPSHIMNVMAEISQILRTKKAF